MSIASASNNHNFQIINRERSSFTGTRDTSGRPVVLCDAPCVARAGLNRYEVATLLLYYASIPWWVIRSCFVSIFAEGCFKCVFYRRSLCVGYLWSTRYMCVNKSERYNDRVVIPSRYLIPSVVGRHVVNFKFLFILLRAYNEKCPAVPKSLG